MAQSTALTRFLRALEEVHQYHMMFELIRDMARGGARCLPESKFLEVLRRHVPEDRVAEFDVDAWRVAVEHIFTNQLTLLDAVPPNNLLIVMLVAHFEAFLESLREERNYAWPKRMRDGNTAPKGDRYPSYSQLRSLYSHFGVDMAGCEWSWDDLDELVSKRHCIAHRGAGVYEEYLEKLKASPRLGPQRPCLPSDGDHWRVLRLRAKELWVFNAELLLHLRQLQEVAVFLDTTCAGPPADAVPH